jgi:hypothetical protein
MRNQTDINVMAELKERFKVVGIKGINTSAVKLLREEVHRNNAHEDYNSSRYETMEFEIGIDATMVTFPHDNTLLHHVVSSVIELLAHHLPKAGTQSVTRVARA